RALTRPTFTFSYHDQPTTEIYTLSLHDALPIYCRRGKEQHGEWRVPRAVKNVARDYEKIFPRVPGTHAPVRDDDDCKKGDERKRSEEHTSELQSRFDLVCRLLLEKKKVEKHDDH